MKQHTKQHLSAIVTTLVFATVASQFHNRLLCGITLIIGGVLVAGIFAKGISHMACKNWIEYNNNPHHRNVEDCVTRALAKVFRRTWSDTYMELAENALATGYLPNYRHNYNTLLERREYIRVPLQGTKITVNQLANLQQRWMGYKPRWAVRIDGHLTAVVEGKIYDTWDCGRRHVDAIFIPKADETWIKNELITLCEKKGVKIKWH